MKVLVTGGSGYIGTAFLSSLAEGVDCVCLQHINKVKAPNPSRVVDVDEIFQSDEAMEGIDAVVHLAGLAHSRSHSAEAFSRANVDLTERLVNLAVGASVKRFIYMSSTIVHGADAKGILKGSTPVNPTDDYARSKADAEQILLEIAGSNNLDVVILRAPLVYGVNAPANFRALVNLIRKLPILPFGLARRPRSYLALTNLIEVLNRCLTAPDDIRGVYYVDDGAPSSCRQLSDSIAKGLRLSRAQLPIPVSIFELLGAILDKSSQVNSIFGGVSVESAPLWDALDWRPAKTIEELMKAEFEEEK
ncbi:MAG: NAD-dependent epimerase/dehydratase family protein [Pseudomonadales bacterium]|jgi:nucleoside-diphosphate-sugar epimerase